jgi:hypothetical protein
MYKMKVLIIYFVISKYLCCKKAKEKADENLNHLTEAVVNDVLADILGESYASPTNIAEEKKNILLNSALSKKNQIFSHSTEGFIDHISCSSEDELSTSSFEKIVPEEKPQVQHISSLLDYNVIFLIDWYIFFVGRWF